MSAVYDKVTTAVDGDALIDLCRKVLMTPSEPGEERAVAELYVERMRAIGMEAELQPVPADAMMTKPSFNAVGRLKGTGGGRSLLFNGHMDHNPVCDGWTKDPFGGVVEDGWLYGFVHMKAADATYIAAIEAVRKAGVALKGDVLVTLVCGELRGGSGTKQALKEGWKADYFVLGEPTELDFAVRHTASTVVNMRVIGRMKHYATADVPGHKGINAVEKAARLIQALGPSHRPLLSRRDGGWLTFTPRAGFEGLPQLNIGSVRAGISHSHDRSRPALMPDTCTLTVDLRSVPGMTRDTIASDFAALVERIRAEDPDFSAELEFTTETFPHPFESDPDSEVVHAVRRAHAHVTGEALRESDLLKFAASDASWMARAGIPGVVYGPTGKYLSRPDERGSVTQIVDAAKAYACVITDICG